VTEGKGRLRFGIQLPNTGDWVRDRDLIQAIEDLGFDSGMYGEHPSFTSDCWTTLAAFAAVTHRLRLVTISCVYFRSPPLLVRHPTDVDRLSGGRLVLGLGAGWAKGDFDYLGIPFPTGAERVRYLEETIQTVRQLWSDPPVVSSELFGYTFGGPCNIQPSQRPYVPLLVAGAGPKILRQAADYGDMVQLEVLKVPTPGEVRAKFDLLRRLCNERGRNFDSVIRSHALNIVILAKDERAATNGLNALPPLFRNSGRFLAMTPAELVAYYQAIIDGGANYLYFNQRGIDIPTIRLFAETVMPELRDYYASTTI
jgi:alkanesulfonate monooxygenase SsuD/methylene tetrahydromethanopterin reductase-like flavin-dependent oxidoreductase (luciferase family)